jgi:methyl-accepting chemotaxis protein
VSSSLTKIVESVEKASQLIGEIAAASKEQAQGIEQLNQAVTQIDHVTQSNAASSEEAASAGEELSAQATELTQMVSDLTAILLGTANGGAMTNGGKSHSAKRLGSAAPARDLVEVSGSQREEIKPDQVLPMEETELEDF